MNDKYKEQKISEIEDNRLLYAVKNIASAAIWVKDNIWLSDDGAWDYMLNKALEPFREDLEALAEMDIEEMKNNYSGELTVERLLREFADFWALTSSMSPVGAEEARFTVAYEFLEMRMEGRLTAAGVASGGELRKEYFWDDIHKDIRRISKGRYGDGHYSDAVEAAFKEVIKRVKDYVNLKTGGGFDGDKAMNRAFGSTNQEPLIKFNSLSSEEEQNEQRGLFYLFKGIVGIRNRKAHENVVLDDPLRALEYLALASLLMRLLDQYDDS